MTETPPPPDPASASGKVADLEKQLADAAAQVAKVQAELSQARAADPNHPQVPVPYAGKAPVVMINGQQVPAGQAIDLSAMLGGFFGGAGAAVRRDCWPGRQHPARRLAQRAGRVRRAAGRPLRDPRSRGRRPCAQLARAARSRRPVRGPLRAAVDDSASAGPPPSFAQPGPAQALAYSTTPGEITSSGNKALVWLAAVLVIR